MAWYPSGKGMVCKTIIRGFDPHPRLKNDRKNISRGGGIAIHEGLKIL